MPYLYGIVSEDGFHYLHLTISGQQSGNILKSNYCEEIDYEVFSGIINEY